MEQVYVKDHTRNKHKIYRLRDSEIATNESSKRVEVIGFRRGYDGLREVHHERFECTTPF